MGLDTRVTRLEQRLAPARLPATLADLVACTRGQDDPDRYDWTQWAPLFDQARHWHDQHKEEVPADAPTHAP